MPSPYQQFRRNDRVQLDDIDDYRWAPSVIEFTLAAAANSVDISAALNAASGTAARNLQPVPHQAYDPGNVAMQEGWIARGVQDVVVVDIKDAKQPPNVGGNEAYGRLAQAAGVYTLSFQTSDGAGGDSVVQLPADTYEAYVGYRHSIEKWPEDAVMRAMRTRVSQDAPVSAQPIVEHLVIATLNTIPALAAAPRAGTWVKLTKNNRPFYSNHPTPVFTVAGTALAWDAAAATHDLYPGDRVSVEYIV